VLRGYRFLDVVVPPFPHFQNSRNSEPMRESAYRPARLIPVPAAVLMAGATLLGKREERKPPSTSR